MKRKFIAGLLCAAALLSLSAVAAFADGRTMGASGDASGGESAGHYAGTEAFFEQYVYTDEETGLELPYNLYLPDGYDGETEYPLVVYVADASVNSDDVTGVLTQDGALVWATAEEQEKHPCIVLAPQYTTSLVNELGALVADVYEWTDGLTLVTDLIFHIIDEYSVDESRIYGTGQSQGGMMTIAISDKYPDLYAAQLLVACQWNTEEMAVMADDNLWIVVCEGDVKAYPGMNEAVEVWSEAGAAVVRNGEMWDSTADAEELNALVAEMLEQDGNIHYTVFEGGSHMYTWTFAYTIEGIRDWLFEQSR